MRAFLFLVVFTCIAVLNSAYSQSNVARLERLNNRVFAAYENSGDSALLLAQDFVEMAKGSSTFYEVNAYTLLGILNKDRGFYVSAINNYLKALNAAEALNDFGRVSACLNNIGSVYQLQQNNEKAKGYFMKSLAIEDSLDQPLQRSIRYYNLGEVYKEQDSLEIALTYYNNSLRIEQKLENREGIIYALLGIAEIYITIDRLTEASFELDKVKAMIEKPDVEESILFNHLLSKLQLKRKQYTEALQSADLALKIAEEKKLIIHDEQILKARIEALEGIGDYEEMALTFKKIIALKDQLNSRAIKNQLDDLTYQNELNKKELELQLVKEERDLAEKNKSMEEDIAGYSARIIWFLIASIIGIFSFVIYALKKMTR